uniref:Matrix protein n=1 Tax=Feline coronavirus TaxID=12663 RepID=A0A7G7FDR9_9ALPC|nr:matrix protein [Feline coronavirus]
MRYVLLLAFVKHASNAEILYGICQTGTSAGL